ncbi:hypothetical protein FRC18_011827 [Serendipita sp. 400]|nr:hypothetical protein FRC18_011827 [Serendipita sp. 400]
MPFCGRFLVSEVITINPGKDQSLNILLTPSPTVFTIDDFPFLHELDILLPLATRLEHKNGQAAHYSNFTSPFRDAISFAQ